MITYEEILGNKKDAKTFGQTLIKSLNDPVEPKICGLEEYILINSAQTTNTESYPLNPSFEYKIKHNRYNIKTL